MQDWYGNNWNVCYSYFFVFFWFYYYLNIYGFQGDVLDDLFYNNGVNFVIYDRFDFNQCVVYQKGGWWYNYCIFVLFIGWYYYGGFYIFIGGYYDGIYWKDWLGYGYFFKFIFMIFLNVQNKNIYYVVYRFLLNIKGQNV